jgi:hypothetical protein
MSEDKIAVIQPQLQRGQERTSIGTGQILKN